MLCKNGLHKLDPEDPWRGPSRERCKKCHRAKRRKAKRIQTLNGNSAVSGRRWVAKGGDKNAAAKAGRTMRPPGWRQMRNDTRRLGISAAEWRRQVAQGIIIIINETPGG